MLRKSILPFAVLFILITAAPSIAGARINIDKESYIDLGFRVHARYAYDNSSSGEDNFNVTQARLRMKGVINQYAAVFIQTDAAQGEFELIDAMIEVTINPLIKFYAGRNMAPASRQNLTSSEAMLAIDRPAIAHKTLTWGARAVPLYTQESYDASNPGLNNSINNRDTGLTAHGNYELYSGFNLKYYLGIYEGIQQPDSTGAHKNQKRFTGRVQMNLFDPEDQYYNLSNYLGHKKTIALGLGIDWQNNVARTTTTSENYRFYTVDLFTEYPVGPGSITFEAAYQILSLGGAVPFDRQDLAVFTPGYQAAGSGYYAQAGYFFNDIQPWIMYESWAGKSGNAGSFFAVRAGVSLYFKENNANVKVGVEYFSPADSERDAVYSATIGLFAQY